MNEKYNLKNDREDYDMLATNSMFVSSAPKERMLDLEKKYVEEKEPEYPEENKKTKDTSLNNLILPAPKIITFNKNEPKHELMFIPVNKIDKLKNNDDSEDEIKDILLNGENKVNSNNRNKLRKKDSLFKENNEIKMKKEIKRSYLKMKKKKRIILKFRIIVKVDQC